MFFVFPIVFCFSKRMRILICTAPKNNETRCEIAEASDLPPTAKLSPKVNTLVNQDPCFWFEQKPPNAHVQYTLRKERNPDW